MNNAHIEVIQKEGISFIATASDQLPISDELATKLADKNQAEIYGILRRDSEITGEKLTIIERWSRSINMEPDGTH